MNQFRQEPYRLFFPLGALYGVWGGLIWAAFSMNLLGEYPGALHAQIMIGGFLGAFATGFLMTAIPKFTRTFPPDLHELVWVAVPLLLLPLFATLDSKIVSSLGVLVSLLGLIKFAARRFLRRSAQPPPSFVFLGIGLGSAVLGLTLQLLVLTHALDPGWFALGRILFLQCFILSLVIGVGCRLIPALLGWGPVPVHAGELQILRSSGGSGTFSILGAIFLLSYVVEVEHAAVIGRLLRCGVITYVGFNFWSVHKLPFSRSKLAWSLWVSCWMLLIGSWGSALMSTYHIHFLHLAFIGGLGLATLMIATRVVIAHGGFSLALESQSRPLQLWLISSFIVLAAFARVAAAGATSHYVSTLALASLLWTMGLVIWMFTIGKRC